MEKLRKESWKNLVLATLIILSMYAGMYLIAFHLVSDTMVSKGLVVGNILIYTPVVLFFLGLVYGLFKGFSIWLLILVFLLYPVTIFFFQEWILLYQLAYTFCALIGNGLGALLFSLVNSQSKF
ncbi:membrane protein [Streptococcus suis]|uniref:Membrane protein n=1 Tax=Streptococcus suis TaxID=1307 RepID=A0A0Z8NVI7_STRSU|nr:membrane protein [Streptococcus suis]